MMVSTVFLLILISVMYSLSLTSGISNTMPTPNSTVDSTNQFNAFQHKLEQIDLSLQDLKEKAHTWAIFRHHIDSWNDQMVKLEHKMNLITRAQEEYHNFQNKLTSLEFTLNHILSKVVLLSGSYATESSMTTVDNRANEFEETLKIIQKSMDVDKKFKTEISTRLSNILRHVQNIEIHNCRKQLHNRQEELSSKKPPATMSATNGCKNNQHNELHNTDDGVIKKIEQKLNVLQKQFPQHEFKELISVVNENSKTLENILLVIKESDNRKALWQEKGLQNLNKMINSCSELSVEVNRFTESADVLLKRIEFIVKDVNEKVTHKYDNTNVNNNKTNSQITPNITNLNNNEEIIDENENENEHDVTEISVEVEFIQANKIGCHELNIPRIDGIYKFNSPEFNKAGRDFNERCCAFATKGPAWTVIQNRGPYIEQENFNRSWTDYRSGFGSLDKDFWFGNEFIHQLVYQDDYELRIEMEDFEGIEVWAEYSLFRIDSESYNYNLLIGGYNGSVPDAMKYHNEMDFSTYDQRNDYSLDACCSCATGYASGWWFNNCSEANLNGIYHHTPFLHNYVGIIWEKWHGDYSLNKARMLIRPRNNITIKLDNSSSEDP